VLDYGLEPRPEVSWEVRLATIGRMLDRRGPDLPTLHITVLRDGIVLQRPAEVDDALRRLGLDPVRATGRGPLPASGWETPDSTPQASAGDEPFIVKRLAVAPPPPDPVTLSAVARERLRRLMRSARTPAAGS
jgi:hypothetical protein